VGLIQLTAYVAGAQHPGPTPISSGHFVIDNRSNATPGELNAFLKVLNSAWDGVAHRLGKEPPSTIQVVLEEGRGVTNSRNGLLTFYRANDLRDYFVAPPHELVHLTTGYVSDHHIEEGLAVWIAHALEPLETRLFPQFAQSLDAWVTLYLENGTLLPLRRALRDPLDFDINGSVGDTTAWQTYTEMGSFLAWMADARGMDAVWKLWKRGTDERPPTIADDDEHEWLEAVKAKRLSPKPCIVALGRPVASSSEGRLRLYCALVDLRSPSPRPEEECAAVPTVMHSPLSSQGLSGTSGWLLSGS